MTCYADPRADEVVLGSIPGSPPDLSLADKGCSFEPRCALAEEICAREVPLLTPLGVGKVACHVRARERQPVAVEVDGTAGDFAAREAGDAVG